MAISDTLGSGTFATINQALMNTNPAPGPLGFSVKAGNVHNIGIEPDKLEHS
ncbi:MAG: hypothetical protein OEY94_07445 [Alphaproteobacteria bacterium]|nr:hypothetical protein [Alphaproteobacteria bacterium]